MEEQPSFDQASESKATPTTQAQGFLSRLARLLLASFVCSALYALLVGPRNLAGFSDGLFIAGAVMMVIGLLPLVGEIFGRATMPFRMEDGDFEDILNEERKRSRQGGAVTYLFGVGGIIAIVLSFMISFNVR